MKTIRIQVGAVVGGGYSVALFSDAAVAAPDASALIPDDLDKAMAPAALGQGALDEAVRSFVLDNPQSVEFGPIGEYLAGLLLRSDVGKRWEFLRQQHPEGLRTLLEIDPPHLRLIPWELMSRNDQRLFINPDFVFARVDELRADQTLDLVPVRLLVVEGTRDEALGTAIEIRGIKSALRNFRGRIDAEFLHEPAEHQLRQAFARVRPHIFHFVGHGMRDPATDQAALKFPGWLLTRQYILDLLRPIPRVAVLNACRTGDVVGVRALTEALLSRGAAAVIGMQGDVRGRAAAEFGGQLYQALARGELVDQAVASARQAVYTLVGVTNQERDWCLPSLTLKVQPEEVLPLRCGISDKDREQVELRMFPTIELFVDRTDKRWELVSAVDPDEGQPRRVVRVVGDMQAGKTFLVQWIRTRSALRGRRVTYVDFKGSENLDFVHALCVIRDTPEDIFSLGAAATAFDRFNYDLGFLANGRLPVEPTGGLPGVKPEIPVELKLGGNNAERIFDSFRAALNAATAADSLVLILDHVGGVLKTDFQNWIYPYLIGKVVDGDVPNVRLVVVMSWEQQRDYWPSEEIKVAAEVKVDLISPDEYEACAEEVLLAMGEEFGDHHQKLISALRPFTAGSHWSPKVLRDLQGLVRGG